MTFSFREFASSLHKAYRNSRTALGLWLLGDEAPVQSGTPSADNTQSVIRLAPHSLAKLEAKFPKPMIGNDPNDPIFVGQLIGIQRVLEVLRTGWTV